MSASPTTPSEHERRYEGGAALFRAGEEARNWFVVREGSVQVRRDLGDRQLTLAVAGPGDFVGEEGLVDGTHRATAIALVPTTVLAIDVASLEAMVSEEPVLAVRIVRALFGNVAALHERLALVARPSASRLALAIARLAERIGTVDADGTRIPRRLRDLAADVGLDEAALGEASKALVRARLLRVQKHGIVVPDIARMYEFVKASDAVATSSEAHESMRSHGA